MKSSRELESKRKGYRAILGIVNAMKALSSANLRKGAKTLWFTREYRSAVESAASVAAGLPGVELLPPSGKRMMVCFGSQFGLCGSFNTHVAEAADKAESDAGGFAARVYAGRRLYDHVAEKMAKSDRWVDAPGSVEGLYDTVSDVLGIVFEMFVAGGFDEVWFVNPTFSEEALDTTARRVFPPEIVRAKTEEEGGEEPPMTYLKPQELMEGIIKEYLYIELFAAALEAVMAENEVRVRSMDFASRNIKKKIEELSVSYNYAIQEEVTDELIEIIGGFEAARKARTGVL